MLTTEQVRINTMQVEIKSMMVGKKQLTLSLMRQIIEEQLIDEEQLQFRGVPWGHVNYFWGDDKHKTFPNHMNIVWQKGNELRRSIVKMVIAYEEYMENRTRREITETLKEINYYSGINGNNGFNQKLEQLRGSLTAHELELEEMRYYREVYIPKYHQLVQPLKSLDHFYITV